MMFALLHCSFQLSLVISQQRMDLSMRLAADGVNLRAELLPRGCRVAVKQRLDLVVVLLKEWSDALLLLRGQLQILCKTSKFLADRLRRMDLLKLLTRRGLL
ncbi:MAG: hypothetical protein QOH85_429 [Acidobacteriaceae bacterium]|jgi:hypothetical protein|nr:hypothetical protein [Acidobacteriaceae bacterium]